MNWESAQKTIDELQELTEQHPTLRGVLVPLTDADTYAIDVWTADRVFVRRANDRREWGTVKAEIEDTVYRKGTRDETEKIESTPAPTRTPPRNDPDR